jgi:octaheme c-type cytochrome (tetrathionate reductase family)
MTLLILFQSVLSRRRRRVGLRWGLLTAVAQSFAFDATSAEPPTLPRKQPTADHRQFDILKQEFKSGPEVTAACLDCHTEAAKQMMATTHWTWRARVGGAEADTDHWIGKGAGVINNFCLGLSANEPRCTSCHVGYGWEDKSFDFNSEVNVDCLVCHDTTGTYHKFPTDAGHPNYVAKEWPKGSGKMVPPPDLGHVARHVGRTSRATCGSCHCFGGGGEGVKHGVMDASLISPDRTVDVHMSPQGADLSCTDCHTTVNHRIAGRYYDQPAYEDRAFVMRGVPQSVLGCETCHGNQPHPHHPKLNDHTDKVSCQACHIPLLAPAKPTKMWWDWSHAGRCDATGKPLVEKARVATEWFLERRRAGGRRSDGGADDSASDGAGSGSEVPEVVVYDGMKGSFQWAWKAIPEYAWFNNHMSQMVEGERIDDSCSGAETGATRGAFDHLDLSKPVISINRLEGNYHDPRARIWPVKIHRGIQPYDPENQLLAVVKLFPSGTNAASAYWKSYDWPRAIEAGMQYVGLPYSGRHEWIQTMMHWPLPHMVAPKEQSLQCADCHHPTESRLAGLGGFYLPARDRSPLLDWAGWLASLGALGAAVAHGGLRFYCWRRRGKA